MFKKSLVASLLIPFSLIILGGADSQAGEADPTLPFDGRYRVHAGDILKISVWKEEDLNLDVLVQPDGRFSFPLAGHVVAHGKSTDEIAKDLAKRIEQFIPEPVVTVAAKEILGNVVYVVGKVNKPGSFVMSHEMDVMQALSMAGGTTPFASLNDIKILRVVNNKQTAIPFEYGEVEEGEDLEQNITLQSGDVLVVP
jgi:polysaccharide export outer membrane protein